MTPAPGPRSKNRIATNRDWKTLLRSSANNMLTRPLYDVPRANFANNASALEQLTANSDSDRKFHQDGSTSGGLSSLNGDQRKSVMSQRASRAASNEDSHRRQKTNMPMAAANIRSVVSPTETKPRRELGWSCMTLRSEATSQTPTSRKGASRPLMMAVQ